MRFSSSPKETGTMPTSITAVSRSAAAFLIIWIIFSPPFVSVLSVSGFVYCDTSTLTISFYHENSFILVTWRLPFRLFSHLIRRVFFLRNPLTGLFEFVLIWHIRIWFRVNLYHNWTIWQEIKAIDGGVLDMIANFIPHAFTNVRVFAYLFIPLSRLHR